MTLDELKRTAVTVKNSGGQGHWFKCPNGHIFELGESWGATNDLTCSECEGNIEIQQQENLQQ